MMGPIHHAGPWRRASGSVRYQVVETGHPIPHPKGAFDTSHAAPAGWRTPVRPRQSRIRLQRRNPRSRNALAQGAASRDGCSPGRRGEDTRPYGRLPVPGKGMPEPTESLPTPCRRAHGLHVSCSPRDRRGQRYSQRQALQALSVPAPNGSLPCPSGRPSVEGPGSTPGKVVGPLPRPGGGGPSYTPTGIPSPRASEILLDVRGSVGCHGRRSGAPRARARSARSS
jgi:hypothetical protein